MTGIMWNLCYNQVYMPVERKVSNTSGMEVSAAEGSQPFGNCSWVGGISLDGSTDSRRQPFDGQHLG